MKVHVWDKILWSKFFTALSGISVITSLIFLFLDIPEKYKICSMIIFVILLIIVFCIMWYRANHIRNIVINVNNSTMEIALGDIFEEEGFKIIPFNEYFDTIVDDVIVLSETLNGKYINRFYPQVSALDTIIDSDAHSKKYIVGESERIKGKKIKYKLGTIVKNGEYFIMALTHFDDDNRAFLDINDYTSCLMNMWNECDIHYGGNTVVLPLLGSGITRFHGYENISDQELLEIIIWTFKVSRIRFQYPAKVKIVLLKKSLNKINLYDIKKRFNG